MPLTRYFARFGSVFTVIAIAAILSFAVLSKFEDRPVIRSTDFAFTVKLQERIDKSAHLRLADSWGNAMEGGVFAGSPAFTGVMTVVFTVVCALNTKSKRWRSLAIPLFFILVLVGEMLGKTVVHHPSPPFFMIKHPVTIFPANYVNEQFSYPSGHAARAIFVALTALAFILPGLFSGSIRSKIIGVAAAAYAVWVSVSVIYLGHHWLSDVAAGLLLGMSMALFGLPIITGGEPSRGLEHVSQKDSHRTGVNTGRKVVSGG